MILSIVVIEAGKEAVKSSGKDSKQKYVDINLDKCDESTIERIYNMVHSCRQALDKPAAAKNSK